MIQYGLISQVDARTLEKTLDRIFQEFPDDDHIHVTELGLFNGQTGRGIREYILSKGKGICYTGIDNNKDKPVERPFPAANLIIGDSTRVFRLLENSSQHIIFFDACHCFVHVISDFLNYASKIKKGGYMAWHDTGKHLSDKKDFQHGDPNDRNSYISVRRALTTAGLYDNNYDWELIFDEADPLDEGGGITVWRKK